jgi:hypothetical protein
MVVSKQTGEKPERPAQPEGPPEASPEASPDATAIELRAFMGLSDYFRQQHWDNPRKVELAGETTGMHLLDLLGITPEQVEVIFVNGKAHSPSLAVMAGGDRVALAPPGVPGPYRVLLGFKKMGS